MPSPAAAHGHPVADQPWPAPRATPPTAGQRWKWGPAETRNLGGFDEDREITSHLELQVN